MKFRLNVVDDDDVLAELYRDAGESIGMEVTRYANGNDFIHSDLDREQILMLDLMMPKMDGIQVLRRLAKSEFKYPIILLSGYEGTLKLAMELASNSNLNVISALSKPVDMQELEMQLLKAWTQLSEAYEHVSN